MPDSTLRWQSFNQKKPYFIATVFSLVIMSFAVGYLFERLAEVKKDQQVKLEETIKPLQKNEVAFKKEYGQLKKTQQDLEQFTTWMEDRYYWAEILKELRLVLIRAEDVAKKKLGTDTGIWIEKMESMTPAGSAAAEDAGQPAANPMYAPRPPGQMTPEQIAFAKRYGLPGYGAAPAPPPAEVAPAPPPPAPLTEGGAPPAAVPGTTAAAATPGATNEIAKVTLLCRAVSLAYVAPNADPTIAYAVQNELRAGTN